MTHQSGGSASIFRESIPKPSRPTQIGRITTTQARMARAALGKTQGEVAAGTGCSMRQIGIFEHNTGNVSKKNADVIRRYYEDLGITFIADAYGHTVRVPK